MGSSDAERLSVLETHRVEDLRRIVSIEAIVTTLTDTVNNYITEAGKERAFEAGARQSDRKMLKVALWTFGIVMAALSTLAQVFGPIIARSVS